MVCFFNQCLCQFNQGPQGVTQHTKKGIPFSRRLGSGCWSFASEKSSLCRQVCRQVGTSCVTRPCKVQYTCLCSNSVGGGGRGSKRGWSQQSFWRLRTQADFFFYDFFNGNYCCNLCECAQIFSLVQTTCRSGQVMNVIIQI